MPDQNFIGGSWVDARGGATDEVLNPATGEVIAKVPSSDAADIDAAVESSAAAFDEWSSKTPRARSEILHKVGQDFRCNRESLHADVDASPCGLRGGRKVAHGPAETDQPFALGPWHPLEILERLAHARSDALELLLAGCVVAGQKLLGQPHGAEWE